MFKIESYITPILLSYVDKYIKNFRTEDSQVSLWGGDASFHNLDLRLEVLERELQLPFRFVSGHIHELLIHVPWTKLASEPISITINTIECKLELRGADAGVAESPDACGPSKDARRRARRQQEVEAPPGYIQSLINRIVNNITILCNNIILKYEEEDIVLSVNAKTVTLQSANIAWEPAFVELVPPHIKLRKLISLSDLTVCLDKRNSSGKIDVYQEPVLYRCSVEVHMLRDYCAGAAKRASLLRVDVHCANMDFRLTEQQVPMFLRLVQLCLALYRKELRPEGWGSRHIPTGEDAPPDDGVEEDAEGDGDEASWVGWAWNLLPSMPLAWDDDSQSEGQLSSFEGHTLHAGLYVHNASITFKVTESVSEKSYYGSRKVRFVPFLLLHLQGCYLNCVLHGSVWLNTRIGVSHLRLQPTGPCFCGNDEAEAVYMVSGKEETAFLCDSLFDPQSVENVGKNRNYMVSWNLHVEKNTEAILLEKSPAFAVDYIYLLEFPEDFASEQISELGSDLEYSNLPEKSLCRLVVGPTTVDVCSGLLHRLQSIQSFAAVYEYAPYSVPKPDVTREELLPVTEEDFEALDQVIPQQVFQFTLIKPVIRMYLPVHPCFSPDMLHQIKKKRKSQGQHHHHQQQQGFEEFLPLMVVECSCLDSKVTKPMYPRRLVSVACQLPSLPHHMFSLCYRSTTLQLMDVHCRVVVGPTKQTTVLTSSRVSYSSEILLYPQYWTDVNVSHRKLSLHLESMTTTFTKPKLLVAYMIMKCLVCKASPHDSLFATTLLSDAAQEKGMEYLEVMVRDAEYRGVATVATGAHTARLGGFTVCVMEHPGERGGCGQEPLQALVLSGAEDAAPLLTLTVQYPVDPLLQRHPPLLLFNLQQVDVCVDPLLLRWLQYHPEQIAKPWPEPEGPYHHATARPLRKVSSDTGSESAGRHRSAPAPCESVHSSSDREPVPVLRPTSIVEDVDTQDTFTKVAWARELVLRWFPVWRGMVVQGDLGHMPVYLPSHSLSAVGNRSIAEAAHACTQHNVLVVKLPAVSLRSTAHRHALPVCVHLLPVCLPTSVWTPGISSFPWSMTLSELSCYTVQKDVTANLVAPFSATSTVIVTTKYRADRSTLSVLGVCIHVDIKPVAVSLSCSQVQLVVEVCTGALMHAAQLLSMRASSPQAGQPAALSPGASVFKTSDGTEPCLPCPSTSSSSSFGSGSAAGKEEQSMRGTSDIQTDGVKLTLWMQSTLARITLSLLSTDSYQNDLRMTLDMEDIMASLDLQPVYLKVVSKVSSASIHHFVRKGEGEAWLPGPFLGLVMKCQEDAGVDPGSRDVDDAAGGFLRLTFTRVRCRDAHSRWGARKPCILLTTASGSAAEGAVIGSSNYISEVVVKLQAVDFLLSASTLASFLPVVEPLLAAGEQTASSDAPHTTNRLLHRLNSSALPLLYLDTRAVRLIMPASNLEGDLHVHNVSVFQVDTVSLKPKADNPVGRLVVRPDIYHHAERSHLLNIPGSEVEDRQYQMDVSGLTLHTGHWQELVLVLRQPAPSASTLHTMSENPALEWNNLAPCDDGILPHVTLVPVLSRLNLCAVVAPAIFFRGALVCGVSLEAGATTAIHASFSMSQVLLASALLSEMLRTFSDSRSHASPIHSCQADEPEDSGVDCADLSSMTDNKRSPCDGATISTVNVSEHVASKSRLSCGSVQASTNRQSQTNKKLQQGRPAPPVFKSLMPTLPVEVLFTARTVSCSLYEVAVSPQQHDHAADDGSSAGETVLPLLHVVIAEPHVFLSHLPLCHKVQVSLFDLSVHCCTGRPAACHSIPRQEHFTNVVLETKAGDPHPDTGIPPSFLTTIWTRSVGKAAVLELELARPTKLHVNIEVLESLQRMASKLSGVLETGHGPREPDVTNQSEVLTEDSSIFSRLQHFLSHTWKVHIKSQQLMVVFEMSDDWATCMSILSMSSCMSGPVHPPVDRVTASSSVSCLTISTSHCGESKILLNPWTFTTTITACWEAWHRQFTIPQVRFCVESDCVLLDVGPEHIRCLQQLWREYSACESLMVKRNIPAETVSAGSESLAGPGQDQHYHDDLRAGAFRYSDVEAVGRDQLPLPYQVAFWTDPPAMAWRYPQPRALTRIDVFPVPFQVAVMDHSSRDRVLCSLEYWCVCRSSYQPYATFYLSENEMCRLELPQPPHFVASCSWRVQLFIHSDGDGDDDGRIHVHVSPRALVACMLVDSFFSASLVPYLQVAVGISSLQVSLYNHLTEEDSSSVLEGYTMDSLVPDSQCFLTLAVDKCRAFLSSQHGCRLLQLAGSFSASVVDYVYLGRNCVVDPFGVRADLVTGTIDHFSCVAKPVVLKLGPAVAHTLIASTESWLYALGLSSHRPILTKYVICNDTMRPIRFGQAGTDEDILLMSKQCHMYVWRTHRAEPLLRVGIEEGLWVWCQAFSIDTDDMLWCPVANCGRKEMSVLVKVVSISATQKVVYISGQLIIVNKLVQHLECQVVPLLDDNTRLLTDVQNFIVAGNSTVPSILVNNRSKIVLRLRFHGQDSMWSGDIPLGENTKHSKPWLVKVPLQDKGQFLCVWCRVIVQKMGAQRARVLAILCPLYMICSHLGAPTKVMIDTPGLQVHLESSVTGRGELQQLYCPGTIDHTHSLAFQLQNAVSASDPVPLSYTMIDQREFFARDFSANVDIDVILESLNMTKQPRWPYLAKEYDGIEWKLADQPETDVRVKYEMLNDICSTLLVSLQPWALIANVLGADISLVVGDTAVCQVPHNGFVSPPKLPGTFHLEMVHEDMVCSSQALQLGRPEQNTSFYMPRITGLIPVQGSTQICMQSKTKLVFANVASDMVKEMHIISIQPRYIVLNCTLTDLEVTAVVVSGGKKHVFTSGRSVTVPAGGKEGLPLLHFTKLDDEEECVAPYVVFSRGIGFSCPIHLGTARPRQVFTVPYRDAAAVNAAYVLTMQEKSGQVFAAVYAEPHPPLLIHNKCQFSLLCAQVSMDKDDEIVEEAAEFEGWCVVDALSSAYYGMPLYSERFPLLGKWGAVSRIAFAIQSGETLQWSHSFCILESVEQFVHIPRYGDVKVRVETLCHTAHVTVETVSHVEISARDIRSRLSNKDVYVSSQALASIPSYENDGCAGNNYVTSAVSVSQSEKCNQSVIAKFEIFLQGLCVRMFDDLPKSKLCRTEVIILSLDGVCVEVETSTQRNIKRGIDIHLSVGDLQLDNQMFHSGGFDFAVIFTSQLKSCIGSSFSLHTPAVKLIDQIRSQALVKVVVFLEQLLTTGHEISSGIKNLSLSIGPLCAYIEDTFVVKIIEYLLHFLPHRLVYVPKHSLEPQSLSLEKVIPEEVRWSLAQLAFPLRINSLSIKPVYIMLSIHTSVKLYIAIDHSPLHFASFDQHCVITTPYRLGHTLTMHYMYGAIFGAGWVVGSLELIGSPGGLARTVGTGLRDFVYLPYQGIFQGPWGFVMGMTHGSASLLKHVTAGTLSSVTKLAASIARNIDRLSLDQEHLQRTEELRRQRPQGVTEGLVQGLTGLGISLLGAIGGIAHHPLQSVLGSGASPRGLVTGVGRGLVGAITKPLSGAAELLALTGQGLLHGAGWNTLPEVRQHPMVEHVSSISNSLVKYGWKLVAGLATGRHTLLHVTDAMLKIPSGGFKQVALVLTTQALFIIDTEQDITQRVLSLSELSLVDNSSDPTLLSFQFKMPAMPMDMDPASHARVVDYVRHSTSMMNCGNEDCLSETRTSQSETSFGDQSQLDAPLTFLVGPMWKNYFLCILELAKRHSQGRGFAVF